MELKEKSRKNGQQGLNGEIRKTHKKVTREFFASPGARFSAFTVIYLSSIPGFGNKIPQATWCDQKRRGGKWLQTSTIRKIRSEDLM